MSKCGTQWMLSGRVATLPPENRGRQKADIKPQVGRFQGPQVSPLKTQLFLALILGLPKSMASEFR